MKNIPIGISDFKKLIEEGYYYVDKTAIIPQLIKSGEVVLISRPRRFGKTLTLSMLKYFFEQSTISNASLFSNTAIETYKEYTALQGQFPVIFLSFKDIKQTSWESVFKDFASVLAEEYNRHKYLLHSPALESYEKEYFEKILKKKTAQDELEWSIRSLAKFLHAHYEKKVIILIDEYDLPIHSAYSNGFYEIAINFLRSLLSRALKDVPFLEKGVLTGILTLAKAGIFSGLNNLAVFNLTDKRLAESFGFTESEVAELLEYYNLAHLNGEVKQWYNGYTFGNTAGIYNPWSVLECITREGTFDQYWAYTGDDSLLKKLIARAPSSTKTDLQLLLTGKSITRNIEEMVPFPVLDTRPDLIWSLLLWTGYLTYTSCELQEGEKVCHLVIPNQEIKYIYTRLIKALMKELTLDGQADLLLQALIDDDCSSLESLLQSFVQNSMSVFDIPSSEPEKSYHLFVLGILVMLGNHYEVKSNRESGLGRYDIMLIPRQDNKPAIVIEFKVVRKGETLKTVAEKALEKIIAKNYIQELHNRGIHDITAYGIAFEQKNVAIASKKQH